MADKTETYYVSLHLKNEFSELFAHASFEEIAMYLLLKKLADFKSGDIGKVYYKSLSYAQLGTMLSRPSSQGRKAVDISGNDAKRMVERLEVLGFVEDIRFEGKALKMHLPRSPRKQAAEVASPITQTKASRFETEIQFPEEDSDYPVLQGSSSTNVQSNPLNTDSSVSAEGTYDRGASPSAASVIHPAIEMGANSGQALTVKQIERLLLEEGFQLLQFALSQAKFADWRQRGVTEAKIRNAIAAFNAREELFFESDYTPVALNKYVLNELKPTRTAAKSSWGKVAV